MPFFIGGPRFRRGPVFGPRFRFRRGRFELHPNC